VLEAAAKDPAVKQALAQAALSADKELMTPFFQWRYNGKPAGNGWNSPVNNAQICAARRYGCDMAELTGIEWADHALPRVAARLRDRPMVIRSTVGNKGKFQARKASRSASKRRRCACGPAP
jgi:hypothetical protein